MAEKLTQVFEQDGERFNPIAFHRITEDQAHKMFGHVYSKSTLTAVWKRSNGHSVKQPKKKAEPIETKKNRETPKEG